MQKQAPNAVFAASLNGTSGGESNNSGVFRSTDSGLTQIVRKGHWAYDLGMKRLSCVFCIFAPRKQLTIAARANPELLVQYQQVEREIGHTFKADLALAEIEP